MKLFSYLFLIVSVILAFSGDLFARGKRVDQIPNGNVNTCSNCHINPNGGGARNDFGLEIQNGFLDGNGDVIWNYDLAKLDSDGDGIPNGVELQDANGLWSVGMPQPGDLNRVTNPGTANVEEPFTITVQFSGMNPHVGQTLYLRVIDLYDQSEVGRQMVSPIPGPDFQVAVEGAMTGHSYQVDFFADHNGNGIYDAPPQDHAWRLLAENVTGNTILSFTHNTDFTDIGWEYNLTLNFTGMNPHVGEPLSIRIWNQKTFKEVNRLEITSIPAPDFSVDIPGLVVDESYFVDFFADHNENGLYDAPPTDHAWRLELEKVEGDTALDFSHNTNFTDIGWKYLLSLDFAGMTPHVGQMLNFRVINLLTNVEVAHEKVEGIPAADFGLHLGVLPDSVGIYQVEFFADHNGNGLYDAPPADHSWRIVSDKVTGDAQMEFTHNTNFTTLDWNYLLRLEVKDIHPHLGQKFEVRVVDTNSGKEVGRKSLPAILTDEFELNIPGIQLNTMYHVDLYADFNKNGHYDAPPADHAWRLDYNSGDDGDDNLNFTHNTNFTDIEWENQVVLQLMAMNPHVGEMMEFRLVEPNGRGEVVRKKIESTVAPDFSIPFAGLKSGEDYNLDFYADHNGNGTYDAPPTDHAWRISFTAGNSDTTIEFTHNTNFTDIEFPTAIAENIAGTMPEQFSLEQNYPNPFNPTTTIRFNLNRSGLVQLTIFNALGQQIQKLVNKNLNAGSYQVSWNGLDTHGRSVPSGVYFYKLQSKQGVQVRKMMLLK